MESDHKPRSYYQDDRSDLYGFLARSINGIGGPVLNVGCAEGLDAGHLRSLGATRLYGVEPSAAAAAAATPRYDSVFKGTAESFIWPQELMRLVVFADVLEHLVDPDTVLEEAKGHLAPEGWILISVPNVRHVTVLAPLILKGEWRYLESGILDETHLRFFTSRSFRRLLAAHRLEVEAFARSGRISLTRRLGEWIPPIGEFFLTHMFFLCSA